MNRKTKISVIILLFCTLTINTQHRIIGQELNLESDSVYSPYLLGMVVVDVKKSAKWYRENFGFKVMREMDFPEYDSLKIIFMKLGKVELELIQKKTSFSIKKYVSDYDGFDKSPLIGFSKIAFMVSDAGTLAEKLKKNKVKFLVNLYHDKEFGIRSFIIEDLDGNVLQFNQTVQDEKLKD